MADVSKTGPPLQAFHTRNASQNDSSQLDKRAGIPPQSNRNTPEKEETRRKDYQRFVLTDPVAFQYLESDPSTQVLARHQQLRGYECYIVEQWATSRTHPTFVINTYTGDTGSVIVDVLSVPSDERNWSPRLRVYFKALNQYHARREVTPLGTLMVTNLSSFPSSLTVIPVPGGDIRQHRADFFVNENLKRLGCAGRAGLTLSAPLPNTTAKFHQLYHVSDKNTTHDAVIELVRLCQLALMLFDKLEPDYADGLLCDVTEHAISSWWNDIGGEHYGTEPHDGILGPTTVAAMLGLLMGARNRLHSFGTPVSKDPFDLDAMKRGISSFQKQQKLNRTRRLDHTTVSRLTKVTAKAAAHEGWTVPRAVKSTVAELSGRGGEMISDVVGRRDRAGIAEVETTDYERFVQLAFGDRSRWLWQGKSLKKGKSPEDLKLDTTLSFHVDRQGGFAWSGGKHADSRTGTELQDVDDPHTPEATDEDEDQKRGLRKRATNLKNDAMSGFGKIKGAVNMRSHQQRFTHRTETDSHAQDIAKEGDISPGSPFSVPTSPFSVNDEPLPHFSLTASPVSVQTDPNHIISPKHDLHSGELDDISEACTEKPNFSIHGPVYEGVNLKQTLPEGIETQHDIGKMLRRTISGNQALSERTDKHEANFYPKHLSFSLAEDSVLPWEALNKDHADAESDLKASYAKEAFEAEDKKSLRMAINKAHFEAVEWTEQQLRNLHTIVQQFEQEELGLNTSYDTRWEQLQSLTSSINLLMQSEREHLQEGGKELETLTARLDYEIDALKSRVEDVENIVNDFERGVSRVEDRASELEHDGAGRGPWRCSIM